MVATQIALGLIATTLVVLVLLGYASIRLLASTLEDSHEGNTTSPADGHAV
ncbi:MAG: hypothetical protein ABEH35_08575 [Haloarculaceae archaeon]